MEFQVRQGLYITKLIIFHLPSIQLENINHLANTKWNKTANSTKCDHLHIIHSAVNSDYAEDTNYCKSVTDIIIKYARGYIYFKTKV